MFKVSKKRLEKMFFVPNCNLQRAGLLDEIAHFS